MPNNCVVGARNIVVPFHPCMQEMISVQITFSIIIIVVSLSRLWKLVAQCDNIVA